MMAEEKNIKEKNCLNCGRLFIPERSTKKYCSDTCKQTAFYQRAALPGNREEGETTPFLTTATALKGRNDAVSIKREQSDSYSLPLSDSLPLTVGSNKNSDYQGEKETRINGERITSIPQSLNVINDENLPLSGREQKACIAPIIGEKYEGVHSPFIDSIADIVDDADKIIGMLMYPPARWSLRESAAVTNISIRLRCLIENLLLLNRLPLIPRRLIKDVSTAFDGMAISSSFKNLPQEYPYKELIGKLGQQCAGVTASMKKGSSFKLRLTVKSKVQLISTRFIISCTAPLVSFYNLDFKV